VLYAVLIALFAAATVAIARPALTAAAAVRIMPLGDSITAGPGCWRAMLWNRLQTAGYTSIDFVGSQPGGGCNYGYTYDVDHEGHGGYSATGIASQNQLPPWLAAASPDIVIMHLGTNDMWGGFIPLADKLAAFTKLVGQMRASNADIKIVVAQIIPMNPPGCTTCAADVVALNRAIPGWAAGLTSARSPIAVADLWTGFNPATDTGDGVHPNDTGFRKMADAWYPVLSTVLDGVAPPLPTPSGSSASSSSPPATGGGCAAAYRVTSQWTGGFQGEVTVRNDRASATTAWTAAFTYAGGQQVSQAWNATVTQSGTGVSARNAAWNGALAAGASTSFGFLANGTAGSVPAVTCTTT
jgi:lysophospholipase L1-like esterase